MLRDGECAVVSNGDVWAASSVPGWQDIDRGLRTIARKRGALDVEEAALLCLANRCEIWRRLGKPSLLAYMEDVLGYAPKTARDRVRVAIALGEMPALAEALESGEQSYSALRELTRVVTPSTQREWCDAVRGKNLRQIEELVGVHRRGDLPTDPPNPDFAPRVVRFEVTTATYALLRQAQQILADEHGRRLDDNELVAALCGSVIDGGANPDEDGSRARHQILTTICEACQQGWQQAGGVNVPIAPADVERAECDAQRIGSDREPSRAKQDISPMVRRHVWRRDHGACTVPGCRSARFIDAHHIVHQADGGGHEAENIALLCFAHHAAHHQGLLAISGRAPDLVFEDRVPRSIERSPSHVERPNGMTAGERPASPTSSTSPSTRIQKPPVPAPASHVGRPSYEMVVMKTEATQALTQAGFRKAEARQMVEEAACSGPHDLNLEQLVRAALGIARTRMKR